MATSNNSFLVKNGLSVGGASGVINVIDNEGNWVGATGTLGNPAWQVLTTTANLEVSSKYLVDTSGGAFTVTLPASPATGDTIMIADAADFSADTLTINPNGNTIAGVAGNLNITESGTMINFIYYGTWLRYDINTFVGGALDLNA